MNAGELCNRVVVIGEPEMTAFEAARRMREHHVGDLIVVEDFNGDREPVGVVTDRDLAIEVLAEGKDPRSVRVGEVMTCELVTARDDDDPHDVLTQMRTNGVRRVPIVDERRALVGILTYDDLLEWYVEELGGLVSVVGQQVRVESERPR